MRMAAAFYQALVSLTGQSYDPDPVDLLRISEVYRLTEAVQDSVWPGGWGPIPFPVLLVTPEREYLIADSRTPEGFTEARFSTPHQWRVLQRPRQFEPHLLATFPAFGPPSVIVVGRPEATSKTSTSWVLTLVHERFHQFQTTDPDYYSEVEELDLSGSDQTGMWMLNYPFPYNSPTVAERFATLSRDLARLLGESSASERQRFWERYVGFLENLSEKDRRYLSFQVWQEGVSRYVELRAAEIAARIFDPSPEFKALPDFESYPDVAARMRAEIHDELASPDLGRRQRVSFYAFGAGLALLLDHDVPHWKSRYLVEKFSMERYIELAG